MIFVTYGTQPHDFRFLTDIINQIDEKYEVIVQIGNSSNNIVRNNTKVEKFYDDFNTIVTNCDILITHSGVGSIMAGLENQKKVIAVSRLVEYGEHIDDHQLEVANKLAKQEYIHHFDRNQNINDTINTVRSCKYKIYESNTENFTNQLSKLLRRI